MVRHVLVDLVSKFDESGFFAKLANTIRQIAGIDWDAVSPHSRAGIESLESKGLGRSTSDGIPDVHVQTPAEESHLVDEGDVDVPVGVLEELGHLGFSRSLEQYDLCAELRVEGCGPVSSYLVEPADQAGCVVDAPLLVARIDSFW